jgi:hypothetical protein
MTPLLLLTLPLGAFLNRLRGDDWGKPYTSKGAIAGLWGVLWSGVALSMGHPPLSALYAAVATCAGFWLWAGPGWGAYLSASIHGKDMRHEREVRWIDELIFRIHNPYLWGIAGMALRGLYMAPAFLALTYLSPWALACIPLTLLQGPLYWIGGRLWEAGGVRAPELLTGALWAALTLFALTPHS